MLLQKFFSKEKTLQTVPIVGANHVPNSAGGYVWAIDDWARLDRFLILGSEGGTYYISEKKFTLDNVDGLSRCIDEDGTRTVARIVEISESGRAPKNDPALFALAFCAGRGDAETRRAALNALPKVARTGTHLFHFLAYAEMFRGWGRAMRRSVAAWYNTMPADRLAYQAVKYQQRNGWSHRDALRLAHPKATSAQHNAIYHWIAQGWPTVGDAAHPDEALRTLWAFERVKLAANEQEIVDLVTEHNLPWEAVPSRWHGSVQVWKALLPKLPMTALMRNLARLTANRVLVPNSREVALVVERITNQERLRRARIHPIGVLSAMQVYQAGKGMRGNLTRAPNTAIIDALDNAFYGTFSNVEPTGKRIVLALDVSSSMDFGTIAGVPGLTPRIGSAAMELVTAAVERNVTTLAFSHKMVRLNISAQQRLDDVLRAVKQLSFGGTDCALPMIWARKNGVKADAFIVYTDSETWAGRIHPVEALRQYRRRTGIRAKLIVVGMISNGFSIADPDDAGMLDVVGFDTATPQLMADFVR